MVVGVCSMSARLSSLLAMMVVESNTFPAYPASIAGALSLLGGIVVVFLVDEPQPFQLTERTKIRGSSSKVKDPA